MNLSNRKVIRRNARWLLRLTSDSSLIEKQSSKGDDCVAYSAKIDISMRLVTLLKLCVFLWMVIYLLNSTFCIFHDQVPLGKMSSEGSFLVKKADEILFKNNYCENQFNKCMHNDNHIFYEAGCTENLFEFFNVQGREVSNLVRSEIISEISKNSTFNTRINFYSKDYKSCSFWFCNPTTEVTINRGM